MQYPFRKSARIPHYDYRTPNYYFLTICTKDKKCILGRPGALNQLGKIAETELLQLEQHFPGLKLDHYVVMPNHVHMILAMEKEIISISYIMGLYKSGVSRKIHKLNPEIQVWQRSFHDRIIRCQAEYEKIWMYIENNPLKWEMDCFYSVGEESYPPG